jgi:putative oxidoreductase
MPVLRAIARPMLASIFIIQGYEILSRPEKVSELAEPVVRPAAERLSFVPGETEQVVRISGAVQVVGGSLLALGWWPRLAAAAIAATLVPTTLAGHGSGKPRTSSSASSSASTFSRTSPCSAAC